MTQEQWQSLADDLAALGWSCRVSAATNCLWSKVVATKNSGSSSGELYIGSNSPRSVWVTTTSALEIDIHTLNVLNRHLLDSQPC